jgi:hypothetical protein
MLLCLLLPEYQFHIILNLLIVVATVFTPFLFSLFLPLYDLIQFQVYFQTFISRFSFKLQTHMSTHILT